MNATPDSRLRVLSEYRSPLGPVGAVGDALAGSRVAENSLHRLVVEVARPAPFLFSLFFGRVGFTTSIGIT
jgi:hypothetical protein